MAGKPSKPMTPFDKSVTPSYLYKLKLFLSFLPPSTQRFLAIYIKFLEFQYTMEYFYGIPFHTLSFQTIRELVPYMDEQECSVMEQISSMMNMMEMFQNMSEMSANSDTSTASGSVNPMDFMTSMMSAEEKDTFQNYMDLFDKELSSSQSDEKKGDSDCESNE